MDFQSKLPYYHFTIFRKIECFLGFYRMSIFSRGEKRESQRETRLLKGEAIFRFYLFKQREGRKERRKSKFEEKIKVRNSS